MMKLKKVLSLALSAMLSCSFFAACNVAEDPSGNGSGGSALIPEDPEVYDTTLTVAYQIAGYGEDWFIWLKNEFQKENPGVKVVLTGSADMDTKMPTYLNGGGLIPDVMFLTSEDLWKTMGPAGKLRELSDLYEQKVPGTDKTLYDLMLQEGKDLVDYEYLPNDIRRYTIPWADGVEGIIYNKKMLDEYYGNTTWSFPDTWAEFTELCNGLKAKGIDPLTYPGETAGYLSGMLIPTIAQYLGEDLNEEFINPTSTTDYNALYNHEAIEKAFATTQSVFSNGWIKTGSQSLSHIQAQQAFLRVDTAMILNGGWVENEMKDVLPEGFEMRMAPIPAKADGVITQTSVAYGNVSFAAIPAEAANAELAEKFMLFSCTQRAVQAFYEIGGCWRPLDYDLDLTKGTAFAQSCYNVWADENVYKTRKYSSSRFFQPIAGQLYTDLATVNNNGTMKNSAEALANTYTAKAIKDFQAVLAVWNEAQS